uniref:Tuberin n=5 Tax=Cacopsylla melanoneura TaxID=428564 RepID=A0A8D8YNL1_9HEMI
MSKDKTFEKLRQFFRMKKGDVSQLHQKEYFQLTPEIEREICATDNSIQSRIKKLRELSEHVLYSHLEEIAIVKIYDHIVDLLRPEVPKEFRCVTFQFMRCIVQGQYETIVFMRRKIFLLIQTHNIVEDLVQRLELLQTLTKNGIDILHFEEDIVKFMMNWMKEVVDNNQTTLFLGILVNIIKYNAAHIDEDVLSLLVLNVCFLVLYKDQSLIPSCLDIFDAVVCYSTMSPEVLPNFIRTFCQLINMHTYSQTCWKIMKNVLGTHMGHASVHIMCNLLSIDPDVQERHTISPLRGAMFCVAQAMWGAKEFPNVRYTLSSVLGYMKSALTCHHPHCDHTMVAMEAANCLHLLFLKLGPRLGYHVWTCVLEVIEALVCVVENKKSKPLDPSTLTLARDALVECLTDIENLMLNRQFHGPERQVFVLIERCSHMLPEPLVLRLITYLTKGIEPVTSNWLDKMDSLLETYLRTDSRTKIRTKALEEVAIIFDHNCRLFETEILSLILKHVRDIHQDPDPVVRASAARLILKLCSDVQSPELTLKLMESLQKMLLRPYYCSDPPPVANDTDVQDVKVIVEGLVSLFSTNMYIMPSINVINAFSILAAHLEMHYKKPHVMESMASIRRKIFDCFLRIRVNGSYNVGYHDPPGKTKFSAFLQIDYLDSPTPPTIRIDEIRWKDESSSVQAPASSHSSGTGPSDTLTITDPDIATIVRDASDLRVEEREEDEEDLILDRASLKKKFIITLPRAPLKLPTPTKYPMAYISLSPAVQCIVIALRHDLDWTIVSFLLQEIPHSLRNRALVLTRYNNDVDDLAAALCNMILLPPTPGTGGVGGERRTPGPDTYRNAPGRFSRLELHCHVFPVLASLASYHASLAPPLQQRLIKCLEFGATKVTTESERGYSRQEKCITALTTCTLEMEREMVKLLPEVLLNLSKISITTSIAIPILEFVSMLTRLPKLFSNFVGDQYMSVFAICMPCTNPFKYNHYTVSLAHHVIAVWFLKCRFNFRRDFVRFITNGLRANIIIPFEEGINLLSKSTTSSLVNEDSSNRKRSSSLTEQGSRIRQLRTAPPIDLMRPQMDRELMGFHQELTETLMDLMARYTYGTSSPVSKRLPLTELILAEGPCTTWIVGNKLISITTSACSQKPQREHGVCDRCYRICWPTSDLDTSLDPSSSSFDSQKSPLMTSSSNDSGIANAGAPPSAGSKTAPVSTVNSPGEEGRNKLGGEPFQCDPAEWTRLDQLLQGDRTDKLCTCWCQNWAEIHVRRATGDISWVTRIQNTPYTRGTASHADLIKMFLPAPQKDDEETERLLALLADIGETIAETKSSNVTIAEQIKVKMEEINAVVGMNRPVSDPVSIPCSPVRRNLSQDSEDVLQEEYEEYADYEGTGRNRNPVRRSNSSPEMSATYKNPFLLKPSGLDKSGELDNTGAEGKKRGGERGGGGDRGGNCEAIPEETAGQGTTPPTPSATPVAAGVNMEPRPNMEPPREPTVDKYGPDDDPLLLLTMPAESEGQPRHALVSKQHSTPSTTQPPHHGSILRQQSSSSSSVSEGHYPATRSSSDASSVSEEGRKSASTSNLTYTHTSLVTSKPPISASGGGSQLSPRLQSKLLTRDGESSLPPLKRDRGHTISVMSPAHRGKHFQRLDLESVKRSIGNRSSSREPVRYGSNPSSVFLSLFHSPQFGGTNEKPILVATEQGKRAISNLDWIPPYETHKVGVLYVGPGQANSELDILRNQYGSIRYMEFLQRLGTLIKLTDADPLNVFLGGLETNGSDGKNTYSWQDEVMQVIFHVATMMPTLESDPNCNNKKKNIGNDYVTIVYNESGVDYNIRTVKGQFIYACVVVEPLEHGISQITVKTREELVQHVGHSEPKVVSDQNVAILARQLALHANFASRILCSLSKGHKSAPYASNWLERLRQIKRIKKKISQEQESMAAAGGDQHRTKIPDKEQMEDFTDYTT